MRVLRNMAKIELYLQTCYEQGSYNGVALEGGAEAVPTSGTEASLLIHVEHVITLSQRLSTLCRSVYL